MFLYIYMYVCGKQCICTCIWEGTYTHIKVIRCLLIEVYNVTVLGCQKEDLESHKFDRLYEFSNDSSHD